MKFIISLMIWLFLWLPMAALGLIVVPALLATPWQGFTTPWGNRLHGRNGNGTSFSRSNSFVFLCLRNPCSNWGKDTLGAPANVSWPWLIESTYCKYGWAKEVDARDGFNRRKFYFRPHLKA